MNKQKKSLLIMFFAQGTHSYLTRMITAKHYKTIICRTHFINNGKSFIIDQINWEEQINVHF